MILLPDDGPKTNLKTQRKSTFSRFPRLGKLGTVPSLPNATLTKINNILYSFK